jgi:nucleoside-diphosphate-sugar epimerase
MQCKFVSHHPSTQPLNLYLMIIFWQLAYMAIGALSKIWYALSKTLAERAAWEFCNKNGIDLVTILPSFLVGPSLPPELCSTASDVLGLLKGVFYSPLIEFIRGCT